MASDRPTTSTKSENFSIVATHIHPSNISPFQNNVQPLGLGSDYSSHSMRHIAYWDGPTYKTGGNTQYWETVSRRNWFIFRCHHVTRVAPKTAYCTPALLSICCIHIYSMICELESRDGEQRNTQILGHEKFISLFHFFWKLDENESIENILRWKVHLWCSWDFVRGCTIVHALLWVLLALVPLIKDIVFVAGKFSLEK